MVKLGWFGDAAARSSSSVQIAARCNPEIAIRSMASRCRSDTNGPRTFKGERAEGTKMIQPALPKAERRAALAIRVCQRCGGSKEPPTMSTWRAAWGNGTGVMLFPVWVASRAIDGCYRWSSGRIAAGTDSICMCASHAPSRERVCGASTQHGHETEQWMLVRHGRNVFNI